jgi:hypothetical protein
VLLYAIFRTCLFGISNSRRDSANQHIHIEDHIVNIAGLNKAEVLAALYNASRPQGMGFLHYDPKPMTMEEAEELIEHCGPDRLSFDYLKGRVMKINLSEDEVNTFYYNRDNGENAAENVIEILRAGKGTAAPEIQTIHQQGTRDAAELTRQEMRHSTTRTDSGIRMGLKNVAPVLGPKVDEALATQGQGPKAN